MREGKLKSSYLPLLTLFEDSSEGVAEPSKTVAPASYPRKIATSRPC